MAMHSTRFLFIIGLAIALGLTARPVAAQPSGPAAGPPISEQDRATGKALFDKGLEDMLAGRYETGCPTLAESYRIAPLPGALFTLAECENKWGKYASARTHYRDYLDRVSRMTAQERRKQKAREDLAKAQVIALEAVVPTLTIELPSDAPPDTVVKRNGERVLPALLGMPMPLELGEYVVVVETQDGRREQSVVLKAADRVTLKLELPGGTPVSAPDGADGEAGEEEAGDSEPFPWPWNVGLSRQIAWGAAGVGVVSLLVATITGAAAIGESDTVDEHCNDQKICDAEGMDAVESGQALATASTVTFVVGVAALAGAGVLWFLEPFDEAEPADEAVEAGVHPLVTSVAGDPASAVLGIRGAW